MSIDLSKNEQGDYTPGRSFAIRVAWLVVEAIAYRNPLFPLYGAKRAILRLFGAEIGSAVLIKPSVRIKHPWRLKIGDRTWIGEGSWIDNLVEIEIGSDVCISQGVYMTSGNHDWSDRGMRLMTAPVIVEDGVWVAAGAKVAPGVRVGREAVIAFGSVLVADAESRGIYSGSPAVRTGTRRIDGVAESGSR